jgi:hypothetical protein
MAKLAPVTSLIMARKRGAALASARMHNQPSQPRSAHAASQCWRVQPIFAAKLTRDRILDHKSHECTLARKCCTARTAREETNAVSSRHQNSNA